MSADAVQGEDEEVSGSEARPAGGSGAVTFLLSRLCGNTLAYATSLVLFPISPRSVKNLVSLAGAFARCQYPR
ncbi:hypothetical protein [Streptomyces sp. LN785]|uniref:hypothetical protein n=1 Tax=Streptomyces sp. LN785 TaxID=3112983 RepID=UPI003712C014